MSYYQNKGAIPLAGEKEGKGDSANDVKVSIRDLSKEQQQGLVVSYYGEIKRYVSVIVGDKNNIADIMQDVMVEAMMSIDKLEDVTKAKYYIMTIAKRVASDSLKEQRKRESNQCAYQEEFLAHQAEVDYISDRQLYGYLSGISDEDLVRIIEKTLNEKERKVILLYYVYGHKLKEIGQMLGTNENTIKSISARAKKKLKVKLEEAGYNDRG